MKSKVRDISGLKFNKLTPLVRLGMGTGGSVWYCDCECGGNKITTLGKLISHHVKSCGCMMNLPTNITHGMSKTVEYKAYNKAKNRCINKKGKYYSYYGGRGIRFLFDSFDDFYLELGDRPTKKHSLDRIDNNGNYEPGNVRWATPSQQQTNKRNIKMIEYRGKSNTLTGWAQEIGLPYKMLQLRLYRYGWTIDKSFSTPSRNTGKKLNLELKKK